MNLPSRPCLGIAALALLAAPAAGFAALIDISTGDTTGPTYYRGLAMTWNSPVATGGIDGNDLFGQSASSNFGQQVVSVGQSVTRNGSTLVGRAQAAPLGFYASSNYAEINVTNVQPESRYYAVGGTGSKTILRVEDPSALVQRATFNWRVTGTSTIPAGVTGTGTSRLDFGYSTEADSDWNDLFNNPGALNAVKYLGPGNYSFTVPLQLGQPLYVHFWSSAFVQVEAGQAPVGSNFNMIADFHSTFVLEDVLLYDAEDNQLFTGWTLVDDETGELLFDDAGRIASIDTAPELPAVVPLPATAWMMLAAFGAAATRLRRVRRET